MYNVSFELIVLRASCSISMEFLCFLWVSAGRGQNFPNNTRIYSLTSCSCILGLLWSLLLLDLLGLSPMGKGLPSCDLDSWMSVHLYPIFPRMKQNTSWMDKIHPPLLFPFPKRFDLIWFIVFNATFSNISAISWRPILVVEEAGENHWPWASNW